MSKQKKSKIELKINYKIPEHIQLNMKALIKQHPCGLWKNVLLNEYKKRFNEDIEYEEYGCGSIIHLCKEMPCVLKTLKHSSGCFKVFPADCTNAEKLLNSPSEILPAGVIQYQHTIPVHHLPATNNTISIKISHIYNPSKFWFFTTELEKKLLQVMDKLQSFYASTGKYYHIPFYKMKNKLYCAAKFQSKFHRGLIVDAIPELTHFVKVYFIDYGTVDLVNVNNVYFLHESFNEPNALALRGQLGFVQPFDTVKWSEDAVHFFESLVSNKMVKANVQLVQNTDAGLVYILEVFNNAPTATNGIHTELIKNQFAVQNDNMSLQFGPSFKALETGLAPSRDDLLILKNVDYSLTKYLNQAI